MYVFIRDMVGTDRGQAEELGQGCGWGPPAISKVQE